MQPVLFISGGIWQKPFVQYLKNKGHNVAIVNPIENDTTRLADFHIKCDINDLDEIDRNIEKIRPIFITSDQSDISTSIVSSISEKWGLPCNRPEVISKFTNKYAMYEFGKSIGVPFPHTEIVDTEEQAKDFGKRHGYPMIIKPVDSTMSRGFRKFDREQEVKGEVIDFSLKFSKSKKVVAQKFVFGDMVTLEGACSGGKHRTLATSRKKHYFKAGITAGVRYPSDYEDSIMNKIVEVNDEYVESSGMRFGLTHSEYLVGEDGSFCLLEIGARGGGAGISDKIVPWVSGVDNYSVLYKSLMGMSVDVKKMDVLKRHALLKYYLEKDVDEAQAEAIKKIKGVAIFCHNFVGTQFAPDPEDCRYSMGIYTAADKDEMADLEARIEELIGS